MSGICIVLMIWLCCEWDMYSVDDMTMRRVGYV